jgi:hypothetical protein
VVVEYIDVFSQEMRKHSAALRVLREGRAPLPIVFVDGKGRFAGGVSVEMISQELEKLGLTPLETAEPAGPD